LEAATIKARNEVRERGIRFAELRAADRILDPTFVSVRPGSIGRASAESERKSRENKSRPLTTFWNG